RDVYDDPTDTTNFADDVTNPANYLLVRSTTGTFATVDCRTGATAPDVTISVDSVTYSNGGGSGPFIATLSVNSGLPLNVAGFYRLFVCGTTSIVDATNPLLTLAGNGVTPGTDFTRNFRIVAPAIGGGGGGGGSSSTTTTPTLTGLLIPVTGFTPSQITDLPAQPVDKEYAKSELTLKIPSLGMNLPIVGIKLDKNGWDVTWLGNNAGYLEGSAYPTWNGNSILTSHVTDPNGKPGPFAYINELAQGDKVYIHNNGFVYVYEVRQSQLILPTNINTLFKHEDDAWLTLVTCENFNEKTNKFTQRRIVRAVLISIIPEK
ncbi:MAG: sortase, partial [Anaerolineales bacterium]|nr:sortase [Anaerolineales bacterium]